MAENRKKRGRPAVEIDKKTFQQLCHINCTLEEISGVLGCSEDTIERWCKREFKMNFADSYRVYSSNGRASIRRMQFEHMKKSPAMAIFLGKVLLGQRENADPEANGDVTINIVTDD